MEFNSLIGRIDNPPYEWDAIMLGLTGGVEPHMGKNVWHSTGSLHMWFPRQKQPSSPWEARIDSIYDAGVKELDESKRKPLYDEWQRIAADQLPLIYTDTARADFLPREQVRQHQPLSQRRDSP